MSVNVTENKIGLNIVPCGSPLLITKKEDDLLSNKTLF